MARDSYPVITVETFDKVAIRAGKGDWIVRIGDGECVALMFKGSDHIQSFTKAILDELTRIETGKPAIDIDEGVKAALEGPCQR